MRLSELFFTGMDIPTQAEDLMKQCTYNHNMTDDEKRAYDFGVSEAFRAVRTLLSIDDHIVFHLEGHDGVEEFDLDELIEIVEEKEGY